MIWLLANWRLVAEGVVTAILVITIGVITVERDHARSELTTEKQTNAVLTSANQAYAAQIADQNAAIDALMAQAAEREKAAQKAIAQAQAIAIGFDNNAAQIFNAKPGADLCTSASSLIDQYLEMK